MKFTAVASSEPVTITPEGAERRVLSHGGRIMLVEFRFRSGVTALWHNHPHEQVGYIVSGELDFNLEGQDPVRLGPGGSYFVPAGAWHNVITHAPTVLVDAFTPQREDFLKEKD